MSTTKAELRLMILHDLGADAEDQLEAARTELHRREGAQSAFVASARAVEQLMVPVQAEVSSGALTLEQGKLILGWLQRAYGVCESMHATARQHVAAQGGAVAQAEKFVGMVKKKWQTSQEEVPSTAAPVLSAPERVAPRSIKEIRLAEARAAAAPVPVVPEAVPAALPQEKKRKTVAEKRR